MDRISQRIIIENELLQAVESEKYTSKEQIITAIVDKLGVPRPTVRRVKNRLIEDLKHKVQVLQD